MEPICNELSPITILRDDPILFIESLRTLLETTGPYFSLDYGFPIRGGFWRNRIREAFRNNERIVMVDSESFLFSDRKTIWPDKEEPLVKSETPTQKKPWVQMNEQYLRRAHRGRSKHKRR